MAEIGYAVMRAIAWDRLRAGGIPVHSSPDGPQRFIPVFDTLEQAVAAANGDPILPLPATPPAGQEGADG